jgi:electron transport complex protein RnfG
MTRAALHTAINLSVFALIGTAILAFTYSMTHERIAQSVEAEKLKLISQIVSHAMYDNDIINDTVKIQPDVLLGNDAPTIAYRARLKELPSALVLEAVAPDGYSGKISMLVAIRENGELAGVRVVDHKETPGLGDYIDITKSNWITGFDGKALRKPPLSKSPSLRSPPAQAGEGANERLRDQHLDDTDWQVKKDGGKFDYMAGATITPRAVVKAVHKTLQYFALHHDALFARTGIIK